MSGAEGGSEPQRSSAEPDRAGQPGGSTDSTAPTRGEEKCTHTVTLSLCFHCHMLSFLVSHRGRPEGLLHEEPFCSPKTGFGSKNRQPSYHWSCAGSYVIAYLLCYVIAGCWGATVCSTLHVAPCGLFGNHTLASVKARYSDTPYHVMCCFGLLTDSVT